MSLYVEQIMHRDPVKVTEGTPIGELDRVLAQYGVSGVPVVDAEGKAVGVVSQTDIIRTIADARAAGRSNLAEVLDATRVEDVMERRVRFAAKDMDVHDAAGLMRQTGVHRLVVVEDGRPVGILSASDFLQVLENIELFEHFYRVLRRQVTSSS